MSFAEVPALQLLPLRPVGGGGAQRGAGEGPSQLYAGARGRRQEAMGSRFGAGERTHRRVLKH